MKQLLDHRRRYQVVVAATLVVLGAGLAGCNTTEGFGKEVKNTGQAIQNSADDNKPR